MDKLLGLPAEEKSRMKKQTFTAIGIFFVLAISFLFPIFKHIDYWGARDWGFHLYMNTFSKKAVTEFGQIPFWDPYYHGGQPAQGDAQQPMWSLSFLFVLLLTPMVAFKASLVVFLIIGMLGMWLVSRHFRLGTYSAFLPPILFALHSGVSMMMIAEGQFHYRGFVWLPFVFYFYLKTEKNMKYTFPAAFFWILAFLDTDTYGFVLIGSLLGIWTLIDCVLKQRVRMVKILVIIGILTFLFGTFRFIPVQHFNSLNPRSVVDTESGYTWQSFFTGLLNREQGPYAHWIGDRVDFFYFAQYIGWIPFLLGLAGAALYFRRRLYLVLALLISVTLSFGNNAFLNLYWILKKIPTYSFFHQATRFNLLFIFIFALFAGLALSRIERIQSIVIGEKRIQTERFTKLLVIFLLGLIFIDLSLVSRPVLRQIFYGQPFTQFDKSPEFYQIRSQYGSNPWTDGKLIPPFYENVWGHAMFINLLENKGTINANIHQALNLSAQPKIFENKSLNQQYRGEVYLANGKGTASFKKWTPNKFVVSVGASSQDVLVINQNYYDRWKAKGALSTVKPYKGLLGVKVGPETKEVTFYYSKSLFWMGLLISLVTIIVSILAYRRWDKLVEKIKFLR